MRALFSFLALIAVTAPCSAAEPLIYHDGARGVREEAVLTFLKTMGMHSDASDFSIAPTDLNGDGVNEWIYRETPKECTASANCLFLVVGLSKKQPTLLANFQAGKIGISDEKAYGVRKLLVYTEKSNDFAYETYVWNPPKMGFTPE